MRTLSSKERKILNWMRSHAGEYVDKSTGELNYTSLVEAWDYDQGDGSTTDPDHVAWELAILVDEEKGNHWI